MRTLAKVFFFFFKCCDGKRVSNDDKKTHYAKASRPEEIPLVKVHSWLNGKTWKPQLKIPKLKWYKIIFNLHFLDSWRFREVKQSRHRRRQESHKFAYLTTKKKKKRRTRSFCTLCKCFVYFCTFRSHSRAIHDVKLPALQSCVHLTRDPSSWCPSPRRMPFA